MCCSRHILQQSVKLLITDEQMILFRRLPWKPCGSVVITPHAHRSVIVCHLL